MRAEGQLTLKTIELGGPVGSLLWSSRFQFQTRAFAVVPKGLCFFCQSFYVNSKIVSHNKTN